MPDDLAHRLEMLLVLQWLDEGRPDDGVVAVSIATAAAELDLSDGRSGMLAVLGALGELEDRGLVRVAIEGPVERNPHVTLGAELRADADRVFGGGRGAE